MRRGEGILLPSDVPRDPEVRGFVRLEQHHRDTPKGPYVRGATPFLFFPSGNSIHASARTRQDSLILAFWGSRGTVLKGVGMTLGGAYE